VSEELYSLKPVEQPDPMLLSMIADAVEIADPQTVTGSKSPASLIEVRVEALDDGSNILLID